MNQKTNIASAPEPASRPGQTLQSQSQPQQQLRQTAVPPFRGYFLFFVLYMVGLSAFGSFVNDMFVPSLPDMERSFHTSVPTVQLGLTFGMVGLAIGQFLMGPVSDRYGRKPVMVWSLVLFFVASTVSVFSPTIHFFLGCRLFQGMGAAGGYFLARTIPTDVYAGRALAKTMALIGAINGFAPAAAPVIGGFVEDTMGWRGIFVVLSAFSLVLLAISPKLKESLPASRRTATSVKGAFARYGTLLTKRNFMIHVGLKGCALGVLFAYVSSSPFIIQTHYGLSATHYGLIIGFNAIFVMAGSLMALRMKVFKNGALLGALIVIAAAVVQGIILFADSGLWWYEALNCPLVFGLGLIFSVSNTLAMNEGAKAAGDASAIIGIAGYIFGAVVAPLVGMGDVMHSAPLVIGTLSLLTLLFAVLTFRLPADLNKTE